MINLAGIADLDQSRVSGLSFSNVNPGGDETCSFTYTSPWSAALPFNRGDILRVCDGPAVLWVGRIGEFNQAGDDSEAVDVTAYGLGIRLSDTTMQEIYVDRAGDSWGEPTVNRRVQNATGNNVMDNSYTADARSQGLKFSGDVGRDIQSNACAELMYVCPSGIPAAFIEYYGLEGNLSNVEAARVYSTDDDTQALGSWQSDNLTLDNTTTVRTATFSPTQQYLMIRIAASATHSKTTAASAAYRIVRRIAVYGNHGITPRSQSAEPDGFYATDLLLNVLGRVSGISARTIEEQTFIIDHLTVPDPVAHQEVIEEIDSYEGNDYGTWGPSDVLDTSDTGFFDYRSRRPTNMEWSAARSQCAALDLNTEVDAAFNRIVLNYETPEGRAAVATGTSTVEGLNFTKTLEVDGGTLTSATATEFINTLFSLQGSYIPMRGQVTFEAPVLSTTRDEVPPWFMRADGSNLKLQDVLPTSELLSNTADRRSIFPIKRVDVDCSGSIPSVSVELDQTYDYLSLLQARLDLGREWTRPRRTKLNKKRRRHN